MTVLTAVTLLLALAPAQKSEVLEVDPVGDHLAAWVHRSDFVGFVRPVEASEPIYLDIVEPHGTMITLTRDSKPIPPNKDGEVLLETRGFWEVRCEVERVVKGPDLSEIKVLTFAMDPLAGMSPHPLPRKLEAGKSVLVFLIKPDDRGRLDLMEGSKRIDPLHGAHTICNVVRPRPGVWGLLNTFSGSFYILDRPEGGWPKPEGPHLRSLMECLLKGLASANNSTSSTPFLDLLVLTSPSKFEGLNVSMSQEKVEALRAAALWPDYANYCRNRVVPALRDWVDKAKDEGSALRGLSAMLEYENSQEFRDEYFERLLACARKKPGECYLGGMRAFAGLAGREDRLLRMLDAGLTYEAVSGMEHCATEKFIPYLKNVLRTELDNRVYGANTPYFQRQVYLSAMRTLAKLYNDPEHAPPLQFQPNEGPEMWEPGGRLAELLEYWRNKP